MRTKHTLKIVCILKMDICLLCLYTCIQYTYTHICYVLHDKLCRQNLNFYHVVVKRGFSNTLTYNPATNINWKGLIF